VRPIDIPTRETADFLASHLQPGATLLEVGCGEGDVGVELGRRGLRVTAIDSDSDAVAAARRRGLDAYIAAWPAFDHTPVDAVAFTRSLHHIHPLDSAVAHARELLRADGVLLVEDFAFNEVDDATIGWFVDLLRSDAARALIRPRPGFVTRLLAADDPRAEWRRHHDDFHLHDAAAIHGEIRARFASVQMECAPYVYRYLLPVLEESQRAAEFVEEARRAEARRATGPTGLVGRRFAARRALPRSRSGRIA
jgi:SAM-dependent methyltransferase